MTKPTAIVPSFTQWNPFSQNFFSGPQLHLLWVVPSVAGAESGWAGLP